MAVKSGGCAARAAFAEKYAAIADATLAMAPKTIEAVSSFVDICFLYEEPQEMRIS
jgi:hypothetical protein